MGIEELAIQFATIANTVTNMDATVKKIDKVLTGNGNPKEGLQERTSCLEMVVDNHLAEAKQEKEDRKSNEKEKREYTNRIKLLVWGAIITNVVSILVAVFK